MMLEAARRAWERSMTGPDDQRKEHATRANNLVLRHFGLESLPRTTDRFGDTIIDTGHPYWQALRRTHEAARERVTNKPEPESGEKRCPRCGVCYPRTPDFWHSNAARYDGLAVWCKPCKLAANKEYQTCLDCGKSKAWRNLKGNVCRACRDGEKEAAA